MVNTIILYAACIAGALGVGLLLPTTRRRASVVGAVLAAGALGAAFMALIPLGHAGPETQRPGVLFYFFAFIAAAGAVRMITHPRPVYAALYFILVVVSSAGLFILLSAEFMAFALLIVYAGAILITYLFVIMLAQEAPDEEHPEALAPYDRTAREPVAATIVAFLLLAAVLSTGYRGTDSMAANHRPDQHAAVADPELAVLTGRVTASLKDHDLLQSAETVISVDPAARTATLGISGVQATRIVELPDDLAVENVDRLGLSMFADFPASIELAGVILLMAMLGAVVLARRVLPGFVPPADSIAKAGA